MSDTRTAPSIVSEVELDRGGRTAWGAIIAGSVVGLAVFFMLALLGMGIGLTAIEVDSSNPFGVVPTASPIWLFISQFVALGVGGYVAGRLAGVLHVAGSILHGAAVWGVATLAAAWLAVSAGAGLFNMAGAALNTAGSAISTTASGVGDAASAVIPDDVNLPDLAVSQIGMEDLPDPVAARLRENGITPANFQEEAREAFRAVISRAEQARARRAVLGTATSILQSPTDAGQEISELADTLVGGENAVLNEEDRAEALRVLERRTGLSRQEATAYVDMVEAELDDLRADAEEAIAEAQAAFEEAQAQALDAADAAVDAAATAALLAALASLLGLAAAAGGAIAGRPTDLT
ncbi:hypothetical protein [Gymnodinialimonas ceratoperidinii]|uniref:CAP-Gly protein n=1 Tax=Gymnodinialimonas ceratoperidinii TaxID=2856823 RepID=A0A8F6TWK3_9RHOB|nr:hypothetical protein [Gymnodinialimonas ceratoperidinii]QXT39239.1 hypothetical protein KYE46_15130 [Gymnodinialimonas ceratoperidinii]